MDLNNFLRQTVNILADLFSLLIFIRVILSWFPNEAGRLQLFLRQTTEPILAPVRRLLPSFGMLDLSPLLVLLLIDLLRKMINSYL